MNNFGKKLKSLRLQMGLTQKELAEKMETSKSMVSYYELSKRTPSPDVLIKLADIFNVSVDYIMGLERKQTIEISNLDEKDMKLVKDIIDALSNKNEIKK